MLKLCDCMLPVKRSHNYRNRTAILLPQPWIIIRIIKVLINHKLGADCEPLDWELRRQVHQSGLGCIV